MSFLAPAGCASCIGERRVIYYAQVHKSVIWMLTFYPKNVAENIPAGRLREIRREVENG